MPDVREERTWVGPYDYRRDGEDIHVSGHETHYETGSKVFVVLYRRKEQHGKVGVRPNYAWHVSGRFGTKEAAERHRRTLMSRGYRAIIDEVGGRSPSVPIREFLEDARRRDREESEMRRE